MVAKLCISENGNYYLVHKDKSAYEPGFMIGSSFERLYENDGIYKLSLKNCEAIKNDIIKSIKQTEWIVEIEMEPYHDGNFVDDGHTHIIEVKSRPALDDDGCIILKRI